MRKEALLGAGMGLLLSMVLPNTAHAQMGGWALDRFEPTPTDVFFASEFPRYTGGRTVDVAGGIVADYARDPLVLRPDNGNVQGIVSNMLVLHPQFRISFLDRFSFNLSVPVALWDSGSTVMGPVTLGPFGSPALGDIRVGGRVRIFGESDRTPISLHISAYAFLGFLGISQRNSNVTDGSFRGRAQATLAGRGGPIRWSFAAGFHGRPEFNTGGNTSIGHELYITAAAGVVLANNRLTIGPEFFASQTLANFGSRYAFNGEVLAGVHYLLLDRVLLGAGIGMGLTQAPGTPLLRGLLQIAYAPETRAEAARPADTDGDGIMDSDDVCPTVPKGPRPDPDPLRRGCPEGDMDEDGVFDSEDRCVDSPQGAHPDPERRGCPRPDTDHDGVFDNEDQCVSEPQGAHPDPRRAGCPDPDTDNDTVLDSEDQCPREAQGAQPDPARRGCPIPDRDRDTVPDGTDHCPDQPGAPNENPQLNGCPGLVTVGDGVLRITRPVYFATNRDVILPRSFPVLQAVFQTLRLSPHMRRISVEGHTDDVGDDTRNMELSERRAQSVVRWLTEHGIDAGRLEAHGFGEGRPVQPIDGLRGRALSTARGQNRRVEFHIVDPAQPR